MTNSVKIIGIICICFLNGCENKTTVQQSLKSNNGKTFKTVKIGNQVWMAENLEVDHFKNGDSIPEINSNKEWSSLVSGGCCYYESDKEKGKIYGRLYNWYAVLDTRGLAPEGWHIPSSDEFNILIKNINKDGNLLKTGFQNKNADKNIPTFSAKFAGSRDPFQGFFNGEGKNTLFWSNTSFDRTSALTLALNSNNNMVNVVKNKKGCGFSIRCIKN
jgi:uncharacterized protein (TIGR02145 family)